jgi:hypothetical protein
MCQTVTLETGHNADDLAEMHLNIAEANLLKDKVVNEADRQEIRRNLREGFGKFLAGNVVNVPAEVHFYVATPCAEHACPEPLKSRAERLEIGLVGAGGSLPHCSAAFDMKGGKRPFAAVSTEDRCAELVSFRCGSANEPFKQRSKNGGF